MNDLLSAIDSTVSEAVKAAAPKKAAKPKAEPKPKAEAKPKAEPKAKAEPKPKAEPKAEPVAKPEPVTFKGFELAEGADIALLQSATDGAKAALDQIQSKDADLLGAYLALGEFQSEAVKLFKSMKLYGQYLAQELPASQSLDPALRSNCKWVYEALNLNGHEGSDILRVLGVNDLSAYKSKNPTVIKRDYKAIKDKAEAKAKADKMGLEYEDEDEAAGKVRKVEKEAEDKKTAASLKKAMKRFETLMNQHPDKEGAIEEACTIMAEVLSRKGKDQLDYILSL